MSVDKSLVALLSNLTEFKVFWVKFHFDDHVNVHKYCSLQNLRFLLVHSFFAPSLAIHGEGVGETDIRRPLDPARPWALLLGTPRCSDQAVTTAASWVDGCAAPLLRWHLDRCGDAVKQRDNFFNWGIASEASAAHIQRMIYLWKRLLIPVPHVVGCVRDVRRQWWRHDRCNDTVK